MKWSVQCQLTIQLEFEVVREKGNTISKAHQGWHLSSFSIAFQKQLGAFIKKQTSSKIQLNATPEGKITTRERGVGCKF